MSTTRYGPKIDFARAKAYQNVQFLADRPNLVIPKSCTQILAESPWIDHTINGGWAYLHTAMQQQDSESFYDYLHEAKESWHDAATDQYCQPGDAIHASTALYSADLWAQIKYDHLRVSPRMNSRTIEKFKHMHIQNLFHHFRSPSERRHITRGALAEAVSLDVLNRLAIANDAQHVTVPAEIWNDVRFNDSNKSFDLWQIGKGTARKIQIKLSDHEGQVQKPHTYDSDIAVVYLNHHWPMVSVANICNHLASVGQDDQLIIGAAESMQRSIDRHFAQKN